MNDLVAGNQKEQYHAEMLEYRDRKIDPRAPKPGAADWKAANALAEKYGYFEARVPEVPDLAEVNINLPAGLFRNALKNAPKVGADGKPEHPAVSVYVKCETLGLCLGVQETDLYLVGK